MSSHEIVVGAARLERLAVADPGDTEFWESIETEPDGRYALVIGDMDDAIVLPGTLAELARAAELITDRVEVVRRAALDRALEAVSELAGLLGRDVKRL